MVRALVLLAPGINCDRETAHSLTLAGARAERVHINDLIHGVKRLDNYHILVFPGGFSFGDDIASGKVLANKVKCRLEEPLAKFIADGKLILGICNGFQVMVKLGILPGVGGDYRTQSVTLTFNESAKFEDRWVYLKAEPQSRCVFTKGLEGLVERPVRHGEGRLLADEATLQRIESQGQVALRYVNSAGERAGYPANPNGSMADIAGICDETGRVFGLMPHPECFFEAHLHPRWTREGTTHRTGLFVFEKAVAFARENL